MSAAIVVQTEIREEAILRDTLVDMGLTYTAANNNIIQIQGLAYPVTVNLQTGQIDYDSDLRTTVDTLIQNYAANFIRDEYLKRGINTQQEVDQQGRIHIIAR
jgi:hypothetical protein